MKRTLIAVILILGLLLIPTTASAASGVEVVSKIGDGAWTDNTWEVSIYPNETKSTTITLYNSSSSSLGVETTIVPSSLDNGNLTFELNSANFTMPGKSYTDVTLTVEASGSITPGTYTTEFIIKSEIPPTPTPSVGVGGAATYLVRTNLFGVEKTYHTEHDGYTLKAIEGTSQDGKLTITVPKKTTALGENGKRLKSLEIVVDRTPPKPPENTSIIGLAYNFTPTGATFEPPMMLTWEYNPSALLEGVTEDSLVLAHYNEEAGEWIELECVVDTINNTITASISHFTTFAILGTVTPVVVTVPEPVVEPEPVELVPEPEKPVIIPEPELPIPTKVPEEVGMQWGWIIAGVIGAGLIATGVFFWIRKRQADSKY